MLEAVVIVSLVLAGVCALYGLLGLWREDEAEKEVKETGKQLAKTAKAAVNKTMGDEAAGTKLATGVEAHAAFSGSAEYLKALAAYAEALSKLKRDIAAFVLSLSFLLVATTAAGIDEKFADKKDAEPAATSQPAQP